MRLTFKQIRVVVLALSLLVLTAGVSYRLGEKSQLKTLFPAATAGLGRSVPADHQVDFALFWQVWDKVEENYLGRDQLDAKKMVYGAVSGMVASLGDPYTTFLPPPENTDSKADLRGDFEGVGIQIGYNKDQQLVVIAPLAGTPAEGAGVKAEDVILRIIDAAQQVDQGTAGLALPEAVRLIRGPKGSVVRLVLAREGVVEPFNKDLRRDTIVVKSVELAFQESNHQKVAVLKLSRFGERTSDEWEQAVTEIKDEGLRMLRSGQPLAGVVLDLRNNPGGFLQGAVFIASEFLRSGVVVKQERGAGNQEEYRVNRSGKLLTEPLIVLVNNGSASASEIVAGALQETKRAKVVGEKSFGKGTIQEAEDLAGGAGLHVTVARWLLPSGKSIDKEGVTPDFEVKMAEEDQTKDPPLEKAVELLTTGGILS